MRQAFLSICLATLLVADVLPASAQSSEPLRFGASVAVGVSRPLDAAMRDVYGTGLLPVAAQLDARVAGGLSVFGGVKWVRSDGYTVVVGTPVTDERYVTSLRMVSYRFGMLASTPLAANWSVAAGGGVCIANYEETWAEAGLGVSDRSTGLLLLGEARYRVTGRWSVAGRIEYSRVPANDTSGGTGVNLGGVDILGGVRFTF